MPSLGSNHTHGYEWILWYVFKRTILSWKNYYFRPFFIIYELYVRVTILYIKYMQLRPYFFFHFLELALSVNIFSRRSLYSADLFIYFEFICSCSSTLVKHGIIFFYTPPSISRLKRLHHQSQVKKMQTKFNANYVTFNGYF